MKKLLSIAILGLGISGLASANDRIGEFDFSPSLSNGVAQERHEAPATTPVYNGGSEGGSGM